MVCSSRRWLRMRQPKRDCFTLVAEIRGVATCSVGPHATDVLLRSPDSKLLGRAYRLQARIYLRRRPRTHDRVDLAAAVKDTEFGRGVVLARSVALQSRSRGRSPKVGETRAQSGTTPPAAEKRRRGRFRKPRTGWGRTSALVAALQCSPHTRLAAFRASRSVRRAG